MKASLSLDLDNKWSYMKTHGDAGWESYPSYHDILIPRVLTLLDELGLTITFFVVGRDAELDSAKEALAQIAPLGHEVGNHSYLHEPWISKRSGREIDDEFARAEAAISNATGEMPIGFRGPGFARSQAIVDVLIARGYLYDASTLPTFIGPLARAYYLRASKLSEEELEKRDVLFGSFADGLQSNRPHVMRSDGGSIVEIPVTTMPVFRIPIHLSYVLYVATVSPALALAYFRTALALCRLTATAPSILLHPLDFLSGKECPELTFFPAMSLDAETKAHVVRESLLALKRSFEVVPMRDVAQSFAPDRAVESVKPQAAGSRT